MPKVPDIQELSFEDDHLHLQVDGREYTFKLADTSPSLLDALLGVKWGAMPTLA